MRDKWDDFWDLFTGMRKFLLMLIVFVIAIVFRAKGWVDGAQVTDLVKSIVLGYFASNGAEYVTGAVQTHYAAKTAPTPVAVVVPEESPEVAAKQEIESLEGESENG